MKIPNKSLLNDNLQKVCNGYHLIHPDSPINETNWENVNVETLEKSGYNVIETSNGSHDSGRDITAEIVDSHNNVVRIKKSNKSAKYSTLAMDKFKISSYRLTSFCSDKQPGDLNIILEGIKKKVNFDYYSILVRKETVTKTKMKIGFHYDWYLIPADHPVFDPYAYTWVPKIGNDGDKKGEQVGWKTNKLNGSSMVIEFSQSSQLWIEVKLSEEFNDFKVGSCSIDTTKNEKISYSQIFEAYSK